MPRKLTIQSKSLAAALGIGLFLVPTGLVYASTATGFHEVHVGDGRPAFRGAWRVHVATSKGSRHSALSGRRVAEAVVRELVSRIGGAAPVGSPLPMAQTPPVPPALTSGLLRLGVNGAVAAHCVVASERDGGQAFAVAVRDAPNTQGGRYLVVPERGTLAELSRFSDGADLSCYTAAEARTLDDSIRTSTIIHGKISPQFETTVVCGFVDATSARCWQYSPAARRYVVIGQWQT